MAKLVVNNSQMQCSQGTDISAINISSQNIVAIAGEFVATEEDKEDSENYICKLQNLGYLPSRYYHLLYQQEHQLSYGMFDSSLLVWNSLHQEYSAELLREL